MTHFLVVLWGLNGRELRLSEQLCRAWNLEAALWHCWGVREISNNFQGFSREVFSIDGGGVPGWVYSRSKGREDEEDFNESEAGPLPLLISGLPNFYFQHRTRCWTSGLHSHLVYCAPQLKVLPVPLTCLSQMHLSLCTNVLSSRSMPRREKAVLWLKLVKVFPKNTVTLLFFPAKSRK